MSARGTDRSRRTPRTAVVGALLAVALSACGGATLPSTQLMDARLAYQQARAGNAAQYAPGNLLEARRALETAESAYHNERDIHFQWYTAYVALRQAQYAKARGDAIAAQAAYEQEQAARRAALEGQAAAARAEQAQAEQQRAQAERQRVQAEQQRAQAEQQRLQAQEELARRDAELAQREAQLKAEQQAHAQTDAALAARAEQAERDRNEAIATLRRLAAIQETERGLVITLAGSLLFRTDEATLLPVAKERLDQVATALRTLAGGQTLVVEGHTDAVGTSDYNRRLSAARADAVRSYLISRGVPPEQIVAVAKGEDEPVAPNTTAEGRANNRRVEIVIERPSVPTAAQR